MFDKYATECCFCSSYSPSCTALFNAFRKYKASKFSDLSWFQGTTQWVTASGTCPS